MSAMTASLFSLPWAQYRRHPTFYLWYDLVFAAGAAIAIAVMVSQGFTGLFPTLEWWTPVVLPVALYVHIMAHVFIHNASHGNFPKPINRIVGEICGVLVLTRFASWEIVHRRHHRYSDDPDRDPHPAERGYWRYAFNSIVNVEKQLKQQYFDLYGDTPATRRYERIRAGWSFISGTMLVVAFFFLMGPAGFFLLFVPASIGAGLFVIHFNWVGHNAHRADKPITPADLDYGWFWLGNRMFFGIYFHGTHHKMAMVFNPMKAAQKRMAKRVDEDSGVREAA